MIMFKQDSPGYLYPDPIWTNRPYNFPTGQQGSSSFPSLNIDNTNYGPSPQKSRFDDEVEASRNTRIYERYDTTEKERSSLNHVFEELGKSKEQRSFLDDSSSWDSADDSAYISNLSNQTSSPTVSHSKFK